jgi:ribosomal protein S18 acetylase RimI-like enzyme
MNVDLRPLAPEDVGALHAFFASVPAEEWTFFKEDVNDPAVAERWVHDERCVRRLAVGSDGSIVAFAALRPGIGGSSHVADVTLVVAEAARRQGLGRALARQMLIDALEHGFKKVVVETAANNSAAIQMFRKIGFQPEALLRDHFYGRDGELHDIVILAHAVDDTWSAMTVAGIDEAVG